HAVERHVGGVKDRLLTPQAASLPAFAGRIYETCSAILCLCDVSPDADLVIAESGPDLVLVGRFHDRYGAIALHSLWFDDARTGDPQLLAVTSGAGGTLLCHLNGKPLGGRALLIVAASDVFQTFGSGTLAFGRASLERNRARPCTLRYGSLSG